MTFTRHAAPALRIEQLCFAYPGEPPLIADWSARIGVGVSCVRGDTGSGKSTLLRLLAGTLPASSGRLALCGMALAVNAEAYRAQIFWRDATEPADDTLTPAAIVATVHATQANFDSVAWLRHVEGFGLGSHIGKPLYAMSTGSRRKVWLAAALAAASPLILLDEPTAGLDASSIAYLRDALEAAGERSIVIVAGGDPDRLPFVRAIELPLR